jgi:hypothetical protein
MSIIFPRLDPNLVITTGVEGPTALKSIEAIKQEVVQKLSQVGVGKQLHGEVLAKLTDGSFIARVNGTPMRLSLPGGTQIGEKLALTLLHLTPRPVFLLNGQNQVTLLDPPKKANARDTLSQNHSNISIISADSLLESDALPQQKNQVSNQLSGSLPTTAKTATTASQEQTPLNQLSPSAKSSTLVSNLDQEAPTANNLVQNSPRIAASAQTALSPAGQLINQLLQETSGNSQKIGIRENTPLLTAEMSKLPKPQIARHIESTLLKNISQSGVFYESHVAEWSVGKRSIAELQAEPQAKIVANVDTSILSNKEDRNHASLVQLVHQQLDVLEQQKLQWNGMLAPQMPLQWSIEESSSHQHANAQEDAPENHQWHSYLRVALPNLGVVAMHIDLNSGQLQIKVKSEDLATSAILRSKYSELQQAIEDTGTHIQSFTVQHDEQA